MNQSINAVMRYRIYILFLIVVSTDHLNAQNLLKKYIDSAKSKSPLIKDNQNQLKTSDIELQRLKIFFTKAQTAFSANILFSPIVSHDGSTKLELNSNGADKYYGFDLSQTNGGLYQGLFTYTQPLFGEKKYEVFARQMEVSKQLNQNAVKLTEHDIEKLVTDQYILCQLDKKQIDFTDSMLHILSDQAGVVQKLAANNLLKQTDVTLLKIEAENTKNQLLTFKSIYKRDFADLNLISGITDTTIIELPDLSLGLYRDNIVSSNYDEKFKIDSLGLVTAQQSFEVRYKPQVNFFTNAGLNAVYVPQILNRLGFSAGLSLSWIINDGHQKELMQKKTNIQLQTVSAYKENFAIQNNIRKNKFITELQSYDDRRDNLRKQLTEYQNILDSYKKEILQGQLSVINYLTVVKTMMTVKRDLILLDTNSLLLTNAYNYWNW
jgi:hypothetical protein